MILYVSGAAADVSVVLRGARLLLRGLILTVRVVVLNLNTLRALARLVGHRDCVVVDRANGRALFDDVRRQLSLLGRHLNPAHVHKERQARLVLAVDAHIEKGNHLIGVRGNALIEHFFRVEALAS